MDEPEASISKAEAEIKTGDDGPVEEKPADPEPEPEPCSEPVKNQEKEEKPDLECPVPEGGSGLDSFVKPLVEELTQEAKSLVENVLPSSFNVSEVEKTGHDQPPEPLPTSDTNVCESSEDANKALSNEKKEDLDENPREMKTGPFVAVSAGSRASWTNCCGLLDIFSRSDQ